MNIHTQKFFINGAAGQLECTLDLPETTPRGIALIAHPHPLYSGTMNNKVVQMMARTFMELGHVSACMNFRGAGKSEGLHDEGRGETDDMALLLAHMKAQYPGLPVALAGFSFGTYVQAQLQQRLVAEGTPCEQMVLVSVTAGKWAVDSVPENTILIHGELDGVIPLADVFDWARPQDLPITVITGGDHLFNHKLHHLRNIISAMWHS